MKVLIISHNCVSTHQSMGKTFCSLFSNFPKNELSQLYIYPTIPNIDFCDSYYRITDKDVLKGLFKFRVKGRKIESDEIKSDCTLFENNNDETFYRNKKNKKAFRVMARDFLWKLSPWFNKELKEWLVQQKITHIFVATSRYKLIYDIALKCANFLKVPIIAYICDEYYFVKDKKGIIEKFKDFLFKQKMKQLMHKTSSVVTISEELKDLYGSFFKKNVKVIMTGSSFPISSKPQQNSEINELTYMGNISCNRYISLCEIGDALDEINKNYNKKYYLNIYCLEKDPSILNQLSKRNSIKLNGFVIGEAFYQVFSSAQCLLHVEAFDENSIDLVKNSISTKIADSLGSGKLLIAYGPSNIASMKHLIRNKSAFIIEDKHELKQKLLQVFSLSQEDQLTTIKNALATAKKYHQSKNNGVVLYKLISGVNR